MLAIYMLAVITTAATSAPAAGSSDETAQVIRKLCDAAFAPRPERFDILVYKEIQLRQMSEAEIRKMLEGAFRQLEPDAAGPNIKQEREAEIEANVRNMMQEQLVPRRIVERIRQDGEHQRIDRVTLRTGQSGSDARLSESYVRLGKDRTPEGYSFWATYGQGRFVAIGKRGTMVPGAPPLDRWLSPASMPNLVLYFGAPDSGRVVTGEQRIQDFLAGKAGTAITLKSVSDPRAEAPLQLVEFVYTVTGELIVSLLVDPGDYRRVYEVQAHGLAGNRTTGVVKRGGFLPNGIATDIESSSYYANGTLIQGDRVFFLYCDFDPVFTADEFRFRVPNGYGISDGRESPTKVLRREDRSAPVAGDTVLEVLATGRGSLITKNLDRTGIALTNATSAPAE